MRRQVMKYQHRVMALLSLLSVITYLDRVCIAVAGPRMQESLHISPEKWGWVTGIFLLSYAAFEIPTGALGDRIGPRRVLTRVVWWWSAFTSLTGAVSNFYLLLLTRFCFGMGEAGAYPNASSVISRWIPAAKRGRACGIVWMASQLGGAVSPLLVVPIQARYGWRASFYSFGVLGLIWGAVWYGWFRDSHTEKHGVSQAERDEIGEAPPPTHHGVSWSTAVRSCNLWYVMTMTACYGYALYFFLNWLPTYLVKGRGYGENDLPLAALPFLVGACMNGLGGVASDWLVRVFGLKAGRRIAGAVGLGSATVLMTAAVMTSTRGLAVILLSLVYGAITFQQTNVFAVCLDIGRRNAGAVTGFMNTAAQVGGFISTVTFGYIVGRFGSYDLPLLPMIAMLLIGTLLWLRIDATNVVFDERLKAQTVASVY
jgi:MFS family permease